MKKKRLLGLALLAPLALLTGCGGTIKLGFSPNWYYDNTVENTTGKSERLEYDVTFVSTENEGLRLDYDKGGTFVTELTSTDYAKFGKSLQVYRFHTELHLSGHYSRNGQAGETFIDYMISDVWFMKASDELRPIRSEKRVHSTVPADGATTEWYTSYEFTYTLDYAEDLSSVDYALNITSPEAQKREATGKIDLDYDETYLDNEEIVIAMRGLSSSSSAGGTFVTVDPQTQLPSMVNVSTEAQSMTVSFTLNDNGREETVGSSIDTVQVTCAYTSAQPGPSRRFIYAARSSDEAKKYRNVLLRFENKQVIYSLGKLTYTLKSATFNDR